MVSLESAFALLIVVRPSVKLNWMLNWFSFNDATGGVLDRLGVSGASE